MNSPSTLERSATNTCELGFNVKNVWAMCITGVNAANGGAGTFELADADAATGRVNDVCCVRPVGANQPSCKLGKFLKVGSFFCSGDGSCDQLQVTLKGESWVQRWLQMLDQHKGKQMASKQQKYPAASKLNVRSSLRDVDECKQPVAHV